jgi:hypothetical protein
MLRSVPARGILINSGFSIVTGETADANIGIARFADALSLSDASLPRENAVFSARAPTKTLLQFEGRRRRRETRRPGWYVVALLSATGVIGRLLVG